MGDDKGDSGWAQTPGTGNWPPGEMPETRTHHLMTTDLLAAPSLNVRGANSPGSPVDRSAWANRYRAVRGLTGELCAPLQTEDYVIQSMPDASPAKWHLAHSSWFFETFVLKPGLAGYTGSDPTYAYLFNSYYNAVGPMHCRALRGMISRPTVAQVYAYRRQTDKAMLTLINDATSEEWSHLEPLVELGLQHEQQHQELLLTDLKHMFAQNPLRPRYGPELRDAGDSGTTNPVTWLNYEGGIREIGHAGTGFHFDNEAPQHQAFIHPFQLASRLVTNGDYLDFIQDGGYQQPELWLSLGWTTVRERQWDSPLYWESRDMTDWQEFTLAGLRKLDLSEPVTHVSYFEADAFARWSGARLPTEEEWEVAAKSQPVTGTFVDARRFHPAATPAPAPDQPAQLFGEVWQWTRSSYSAYPGYRPPPGAIGEYNGKFMCNQYVLRGGSCATSRSHYRSTYRNFFPPDKQWQFTGIRLARDAA